MKKCFKCKKLKEIVEFYKHPKMGDGHIGKCKECTKTDVRRRYYDPESRLKIIAYERERFKNPERKKNISKYRAKMKIKNRHKFKAWYAVSNALRNGKLKKLPCEICRSKNNLNAHHDDYSKPLQVRWLCRYHHMEIEGKQSYYKKP